MLVTLEVSQFETSPESLAALEVWLTGGHVLDETVTVFHECLRLVQLFEVHGKQVHDCNIVATMLAHGVRHLVTRNAADFKRYGSLIAIEAIPATRPSISAPKVEAATICAGG